MSPVVTSCHPRPETASSGLVTWFDQANSPTQRAYLDPTRCVPETPGRGRQGQVINASSPLAIGRPLAWATERSCANRALGVRFRPFWIARTAGTCIRIARRPCVQRAFLAIWARKAPFAQGEMRSNEVEGLPSHAPIAQIGLGRLDGFMERGTNDRHSHFVFSPTRPGVALG